MENQPKLNSSKEVIAFLAERFPHCFSAEGEARPLMGHTGWRTRCNQG